MVSLGWNNHISLFYVGSFEKIKTLETE